MPIADLSSDIRSYKKIGSNGASHEYLLQRSLAVWVGLAKLVDSEGISRNFRDTKRKRMRIADVCYWNSLRTAAGNGYTTQHVSWNGKRSSRRFHHGRPGELFLTGSFSVINSRLLRL